MLQADPGFAERQAEEEAAKFEDIKHSLSAEEIRRVIEDAKTLQRMQSSQDSPEALASIPVLKVSDLDRRNKVIPLEQMPVEGVPGFYHDIFTSGVTYFDVGFNLQTLPAKYLSLCASFRPGTFRDGYRFPGFRFFIAKDQPEDRRHSSRRVLLRHGWRR